SLRMIVVFLAFLVYLSTRHPRGYPWTQLTVCVVVVLCGAVQVAFGVIEGNTLDPTYSVPMLLICSTSSTFFRLRFFYSMAVNVLICVIFAMETGISGAFSSRGEFIVA